MIHDEIRDRMRASGDDLSQAAQAVLSKQTQILIAIGQDAGIPALETILADAVRELRAESERNREFLRRHAVIHRENFEQWYFGPGGDSASPRWAAYKSLLCARPNWGETVINRIDADSTAIVSRLPSPVLANRTGRGLVLGHVQSGKTANMMAVIAKAADAGYAFVIILAGLTRALRRQTQTRIESDLLAGPEGQWLAHTASQPQDMPDIDFQGLAESRFQLHQQVQIAVVKKNVSPLTLLLEHFQATTQATKERLPVLIIDDECDQASVNAANDERNTTAINRLIRDIVAQLPKCAYVGYTATPFANVLIDPAVVPDSNEDLYPRDFIFPLETSQGYFGPEMLFGREELDADDHSPDRSGLDMIRRVKIEEVRPLQPARAAKQTFEASIPDSLEKALNYFLLATSARRARGQMQEHASMLVHTTLYTASHEIISKAIGQEWLEPTRQLLSCKDRNYAVVLKELWSEESGKVDAAKFGNRPIEFEEIEPHLSTVADDIRLAVENMDSDTRLNFDGGPKTYIVTGGSVLARGLTIEGLTVSYFTRPSTQFDTLLQMGRWFGYRPGYEDLPRIWMTASLETAFHRLATVEAEIRQDIRSAIARELTPLDLAVRIRMLPGMKATAANKLRRAIEVSVSFAGKHKQTTVFNQNDENWLKRNWQAGESLIDRALNKTALTEMPADKVIRGVPVELLERFLGEGGYVIHPTQDSMRNADILAYIRKVDVDAMGERMLKEWNVAIVEPTNPRSDHRPELGRAGQVRCHRRARLDRPQDAADIKALMSASDLWADSQDAREAGSASWDAIKAARRKAQQDKFGSERPLLLLYPIEPQSRPSDASERVALDAKSDVLGLGILFPDRNHPTGYIAVDLIQPEAEPEAGSASDVVRPERDPEAEEEYADALAETVGAGVVNG